MKAPLILNISSNKVECHALEVNSQKLFDEIMELLENIEPMGPYNNYKAIWLSLERGTIEDMGFEDTEEACYSFDVESESELEEAFLEMYPDEKYWFLLETANERGYRVIKINRFQITLDAENKLYKESYEYDYSELLEWIKESLQNVIEQIKNGSYYETINDELPYTHRYGTIGRKEYYKQFPEIREHIYKDIQQSEIEEFISLINADEGKAIKERVSDMTFTKYFEYAVIAYKAAGYETKGKTALENFIRHGEDFGIGRFEDIDLDSPEAFIEYNKGSNRMGGHPWGLLIGSSRTRVYLYPHIDEEGIYFGFSGNETYMIYEIIKMYLALKKSGLPVYYSGNKERVIRYINQEDLIGIVPHYELPIYCQSDFPNQDVQSFIHYDPDEDEAVFEHIEWQTLPEVKLKGDCQC